MNKQELEQLVSDFTEKTLPKSEWTHHAHLIVALWHNWNFEYDEALRLVRDKIIAYNEAVGTENSDTSGYHESLTIFWMTLCKNHLSANSFETIAEAYSSFLLSDYASSEIPLSYYSKEVLFSTKARKEWVRGDLKSIELSNRELMPTSST